MITISGENTVVTLKDSAGNGSLTASGSIAQVIDGATLKIESGTYSSGNVAFWAGGKNQTGKIEAGSANSGPTITGSEGAIGFGKDSEVIINNGTFTGTDNAVVIGNGSAGYEGAEVTINGGNFDGQIITNGYTGCGVYFPNDGKLTINDGNFNIDGVGVCARAGEVEINGGSFTSNTTREGWVGDNKTKVPANGVCYDGAAKYPGLKDGAKVSIKGGTFYNTADSNIPALNVIQPADGSVVVTVDNQANWSV